MIGTVHDCNAYEILEVHTNIGSNNFTNIEPLKLLPLDIHINEYYLENIL